MLRASNHGFTRIWNRLFVLLYLSLSLVCCLLVSPEKMRLKLVEPLRLLFKDEVRSVGAELGMMPHLLKRHPFPGPGLGIRILGDVTPEKVHILQEADHVYISLLREWGLYDKV